MVGRRPRSPLHSIRSLSRQNLDCRLCDILAQPGNEGLRDKLITCSPDDTLQVRAPGMARAGVAPLLFKIVRRKYVIFVELESREPQATSFVRLPSSAAP